MRIGIFVAYWPWFSPTEQIELAVLADEIGLDSVWVAEAWGNDAVSVLGLLAGRTQRIGLGSALMQIPARQPAATAMAAASLDVLSAGRFRLGLGLSGPQVSEGWYGVPFAHGLARTREYVEIVRKALARERLRYDGQEFQLPLDAERGSGLGKPLRLLVHPVQDPIPIYLGATGPKSIEQTGAIADGWLPFMFSPEHAAQQLTLLHRGAERAGRDPAEIDVAPSVCVAVEDEIDAARDAVRPWLAFYLGAMGSREHNFYVEVAERQGAGAAAREAQERWLARDHGGAAAALTPELIDATAICATPDTLGARLDAYAAAGATTLVAVPSGSDRANVVRLLANANANAAVAATTAATAAARPGGAATAAR